MLSLPLAEERWQTEWETIQTIVQNNNFLKTHIARLKTKIRHKDHTRTTKDENKKWATFTYHSPKVRKLTNLFTCTNINITFKSTNKIQQSIKPKNPEKITDYNRSGVYKLTCKTCNMSYIGQTSWTLTHRYREHICYIRNNDPQSAYAQHIPRNQHEYGTITDTMTLLKLINETSLFIPYEQFFIQTDQYNGTLITEQNRGKQNSLFQLANDTGLTSQPFHKKWIPTIWYTWISSNSTMRVDGSRSRYVKTILLISIVLFPKYFIIAKSGIHTISIKWLCLLHFPIELQHNLNYDSIYTYICIFCCT